MLAQEDEIQAWINIELTSYLDIVKTEHVQKIIHQQYKLNKCTYYYSSRYIGTKPCMHVQHCIDSMSKQNVPPLGFVGKWITRDHEMILTLTLT